MASDLLHAAESGDEEAVAQLLAKGSDTTLVNLRKQTALHLAAKGGHLGIVALLLARCPELIEAVDQSYDTALHLAARNGHDTIVKLLLSHGARVNVSTSKTSPSTALHRAVEGGHVSVVRQLLAHAPMLLDVRTYYDHPPLSALQLAARGSHTKVVALLLAKGADTAAAKGGQTALHFAVEKGNDNIVAQLLAHNPGLAEVKDHNGSTALYVATQEQIVTQLLAHTSEIRNLEQNKRTPLHAAAERGHDGIVTQLLTHSPSLIDTVDSHHCTPLHEAAKGGHIKVVAQLLARKPDLINKIDENYYTALLHAIKGSHDDLVAFLLAHEPSVIDTGHPLHVAAIVGNYASVERLLSLKPSLCDTIDRLGRTPLHCAAASGAEEIVARLLDLSPHLIDSTGKTYEQLTPLHEAVQRRDDKNLNTVKILLARNPKSIDAKTSEGVTALHLAAAAGNKEIVAQLLAHCPALIDGEVPKGNAAHFASFTCCISIVELLLDLKPELAKGINQDKNTLLHLLCRFNWTPWSPRDHDDLVFFEKVWRLNPAALHVVNKDGDTPYHCSLNARDEWSVKFFQSKLSCEEILYCYEGPFHRIRPLLKRFCEGAVGACLVDLDAARLVYGYLGVEHVLCMKRSRTQ